MIRKFKQFINENKDLDNTQDIFESLMTYLIIRLNDETKHIYNGEPIDMSKCEYLDSNLEDSDPQKNYVFHFYSQKLHVNLDGDTIVNHMSVLNKATQAFDIFRKIVLDIDQKFDLDIDSQVSSTKVEYSISIRLVINILKLKNNEKLKNFLKSNSVVDKYNL